MLCKDSMMKVVIVAVFIITLILMTSFYKRHVTFITRETQNVIPEEDTIHVVQVVDIAEGD